MDEPSSTGPSDYTEPSIYQEYAAHYRAPTPPPTNGHNRLFPPPPSPAENDTYATYDETYGRQSQILGDAKIHEIQPHWTASRVLRSIIYFIWASFGGFGILGAFISINDSNALVAVGLLAWIGIIIASIVVFIRVRHRMPRMRISRFLLYFIITSILAFIAIVIETALLANVSKILPGFFLGVIFTIYGLVIAVFALW